MKKQLMILAALLPLLGGCVYDFEAELTGDQYTVVIEGDIIVGGITNISFSRLNPEVLEGQGGTQKEKPAWGIPVSNFTVRVEGEDGTVVEGGGLGGRCSLDTRSLSRGTRYRLCLDDLENGLHYTSSWESVEAPPVIDSLSYRIVENDLTREKRMDVRVTFHSDGSTPYYCLSYDEQWEYHAYASTYYRYILPGQTPPEKSVLVFPDERFGDKYGRIFDIMELYPTYTCWNSAQAGISTVITTGAMVSNKMVDYVFRTFHENDRRVSVTYRPIVSVRMISKESFAYWESLEETSTQTGDLFSPIPSTRRGNILNEENPKSPVIGYVGVSAVATRDLLIKNSQARFYRQSPAITELLENYSLGSGDANGVGRDLMYSSYLKGYRPWKEEFPEEDGPAFYVWIDARCFDCQMQGGKLEKPEGWPE